MIGGIVLIFITAGLAAALISRLKQRHLNLDTGFLWNLFFFHLALAFVYYLYATFNPSDSIGYYKTITNDFLGNSWGNYYGTSTTFIRFVGYPFIKFLGFSYEAMMVLFSFFGFIGFAFFYLFFKENIHFKHKFFGVNLFTLIFFLPNLHFWSSSFGKGSIILMGIGLFMYSLRHLQRRWVEVLVGGFIIYHVRPHIMLMILMSSAIGFVFSTRGISMPLKVLFLAGVTVAFFFIYKDVLALVGIDEEQFLSQGLDLTHRATELTKSTSGVDITSYSLPMQVFTFLFRPLFIDAPGVLGLIVSFENVFYLIMAAKLFNFSALRYLITGNFLVKTSLMSFITVSIALAQISGNLGLAIRQKSQVMLLFLFVILSFLDSRKLEEYHRAERQRKRKLKLQVTDPVKAT